jgi:DMSO/TMAO reductase YedYZ molybdopterin-dependent catalytic subunit
MFFNYREVQIDMVLECASNGRALMDPVPDGVPWEFGGASPITVSGIRLVDLLGNLPDSVVELVFTGVDGYQFSIERELALSRRPILATHIGGEALDARHGGPVRLIVPGQYAMKSVKSLHRVEGVTSPFSGYFVRKYRYYRDEQAPEGSPVAAIEVRSIISSPRHGDRFTEGSIDVRGSSWTGNGEVTAVEVSVDGGHSWDPADLVMREVGGPFAPVRWAITLEVDPGTVEIVARATDSSGSTQPLDPRWNVNGYGNNVAHRIEVVVG